MVGVDCVYVTLPTGSRIERCDLSVRVSVCLPQRVSRFLQLTRNKISYLLTYSKSESRRNFKFSGDCHMIWTGVTERAY